MTGTSIGLTASHGLLKISLISSYLMRSCAACWSIHTTSSPYCNIIYVSNTCPMIVPSVYTDVLLYNTGDSSGTVGADGCRSDTGAAITVEISSPASSCTSSAISQICGRSYTGGVGADSFCVTTGGGITTCLSGAIYGVSTA